MASEEMNLSKYARQYGMTGTYCADRLGIDRQKFWRWCKPGHPNYTVLKAAIKFLIRCNMSIEAAEQAQEREKEKFKQKELEKIEQRSF